jgi:hypothetical protein
VDPEERGEQDVEGENLRAQEEGEEEEEARVVRGWPRRDEVHVNSEESKVEMDRAE